MLMRSATSVLCVIDIQQRLLPAMSEAETVILNSRTLVETAADLTIPVMVSEQNPAGLGETDARVLEARGDDVADKAPIEKTHFSCMDDPAFAKSFQAHQRGQAILVGLEAHVCVLQTAAGLLRDGAEVFVVADAVSSRTPASKDRALARLAAAGVGIVTTEMVVFEWLARAGTPDFRRALPRIK